MAGLDDGGEAEIPTGFGAAVVAAEDPEGPGPGGVGPPPGRPVGAPGGRHRKPPSGFAARVDDVVARSRRVVARARPAWPGLASGATAGATAGRDQDAGTEGLGLVELIRRIGGVDGLPLATLTFFVVVWAIAMGRLILLRQHNIATYDFDEGIYDQYLWQLAHFRLFNTVRGVPLDGHHASFAFILLVPFVWLGGGVGTWDVLQTIAVAGTAYPLYFLAKDKLHGREWMACAVGLIWLAQPSVQWFIHEGFHPEVMALPFLIGTYLFGERIITERAAGALTRRTRLSFVACFVLAISWKEDMALALVGMGLVWLVRRQWKLAGRVIIIAGVYFVFFGMYLVPHIAGGSVYGGIYDLGTTPGQIVKVSIEHPSKLAHKLNENDALGNGRDLTEPYGFVPLLSPLTLLMGLPQWGLNVVSASAFTWDIKSHYQAVPMFALGISLVEGLRVLRRRRRWLADIAVILTLVLSLLSTRWYGASQLSVKFDQGYWLLSPYPTTPLRRETIHLIPRSAGVSADYEMVPQLTHRQIIYSFPNPWRNSNYGVKFTAIGDPAKVQYIDLDTGLLDPQDAALLASIEASGEFKVVYHEQTVLLLHRVEPPGHGTHPIVVPSS